MRMTALIWATALCLAFACSSSLAQGVVTTPRAVPDDGVIKLTDYGFRDWGPELVHYSLGKGAFASGKFALIDQDGNAVPFQIGKGADGGKVLAFVASVKAGKTSTYTLQTGAKSAGKVKGSVTYAVTRNGVEVGNEYFTLALPKPGKRTFKAPVAAGQLPPPILRWKQAGCDWVGGAHFFTERKAAGYEISCIEQGPANVTYRVRYTFAPKGEYVWQVCVSAGVPVAQITEDFDFGEITEGQDFLMLGVGEGWTPEQIGFLSGEGTTTVDKLEALPTYLKRKAEDQQNLVKNVGAYPAPQPFMPGKDLVFLEKINPTGAWGPKGGIDLRGTFKAGDVTKNASISVIPYFGGSWRRIMSLMAWHDPARGVELALPLGVRPIRWYLDLADDQSPFSSHEHDPELPASYGRRVWALGFGLPEVTMQIWPEFAASLKQPGYQGKISDPLVYSRTVLGYIGLDRYKEWVIDWPEVKAKATYPRAYATPEIVARIKKTLDQHPDKALLQTLYLINGDPKSAEESAKKAIYSFQHPYVNDWKTFGLTAYITTYSFTFSVYAEDALACPDLQPELRQQLRRYLALYAYLFAEPDRNPRGAGCHLGNPNMPIGRTEALPEVAALLPDHPQYQYWMNQIKDYTAWKLAAMTEPGGAWFEPPTYQMYGPTRALSLAQIILRNGGFGDLAQKGWHARALEYDANLTMPDVRYKGWRILPGMGNSGNTLESVFGMGEGVVEQANPAKAGFFRFIHKLNSGSGQVAYTGELTAYAFTYLPDVPENPQVLKTTFIPGYGVSFRAHFGSPDETGMLFRSGYNKSHWDMDDLNTILYSKGAPLSPGTGYQYYYGPASANNAIYHNRVKVGKLDAAEPFGRVENVVQDYGFGDNADYAMGREYYPPEYFSDGKGEMEWRRHVLFLKSAKPEGANYFVMRDTFPGGQERQTWWHWLNLDGPELISQQGKTLEMKTKYGAATRFWFAGEEAPAGKVVLTFDYENSPNYHHRALGKALGVPVTDKEAKTIYQLTRKPGSDYFYVVYPHKDNEPVAAFEQVAGGCIKVVTTEATDYTFISDTPQSFDKDGIVFTGKAGAVRIFPDRVVLAMNSGSGRIGYQGYLLEGNGPFERTVKLADLKAGVTKIDGGYEKKIMSVYLGNDITVTGEAPFNAKLDGETITILTSGRARVLNVTRPAFIWYPQFRLDGQEWMAGWTDYPGSNWGKFKNTNMMAVSTLDGDHQLVIKNRTFNKVWDRQFVPLVSTVKAP
ncbi:MAG: hypothetical protein ACYDBB_11365 [Armatimonadota bacterium]